MEMESGIKFIAWILGAVVLTTIVVSLMPFTIVNQQERTIVTRFGKVDRVLDTGIHFVTPWIEDTTAIDISIQKNEVDVAAASKDLQDVTTKVAINYNIDVTKVADVWSNYRQDVAVIIVAPAIQESVKAATAKYTAEELITKRELVKADIDSALKIRLAPIGIVVSGVSITSFNFSAQFNQAIEAKVQAEQDALTQKNLLEKVKYEAEQRVATAEAEAKSIRLQSDAANNEKYVALKRVEVQLETAKRWDGKLPVNMYGSAPLPILNLAQ